MAIAKDSCYITPVAMTKDRSEVLQGTLDLMVLKALDALGPLHGYGIARRLEQISADRLRLKYVFTVLSVSVLRTRRSAGQNSWFDTPKQLVSPCEISC